MRRKKKKDCTYRIVAVDAAQGSSVDHQLHSSLCLCILSFSGARADCDIELQRQPKSVHTNRRNVHILAGTL